MNNSSTVHRERMDASGQAHRRRWQLRRKLSTLMGRIIALHLVLCMRPERHQARPRVVLRFPARLSYEQRVWASKLALSSARVQVAVVAAPSKEESEMRQQR